ncbi:MAG: dihydroorotate dehydrogenase [Thermoplasmatales archaeon]|nr:MAG: dihydroorotate dehydrogenase [Thermoplasmatales archaeon]
MVSLAVKTGGVSFESPAILASGILDENGYTMKRVLEDGAGAVVTKSIGTEERNGYFSPVVVPEDTYLINAMGLPNPGIDSFEEEIKIALTAKKPVIGSIFASNTDDFLKLALKMQDFGVSAVELNLSCPHVQGFGSEVGSDPVLVKEIVKTLKGTIKIPVWSKLSPNVTSISEISRAASDSDALVLINTVRAMAIDIEARRPILTNSYGGMSGTAIKPVGLRCVYEVKKETEIDIIGVGGISSYIDALEYIMAGASVFQIGTALMKYGRSIFRRITEDLEKYMISNGINSLEELVGVAVR